MSGIDFVTHEVIWTDNNYLGLNTKWVVELLERGFTLNDQRKHVVRSDVVATCPKGFWSEWITEGDAAGDPATGAEWGWYTQSKSIIAVDLLTRFYVVAHGRLRGYAIITRIDRMRGIICRRGGAVAVTIPETIRGFQGLRRRWWPYDEEAPFPDWKTP